MYLRASMFHRDLRNPFLKGMSVCCTPDLGAELTEALREVTLHGGGQVPHRACACVPLARASPHNLLLAVVG